MGRVEGMRLPLLLLCTAVVAAATAAVRHRFPDGKNGTWYLAFNVWNEEIF